MGCRDCTCRDTDRRVNCEHVTWMDAAQFDALAATIEDNFIDGPVFTPDDAA